MLTLLFMVLLLTVFVRMIGLAFRLTWGITKIVLTVLFFPLIMVGMLCLGLVKIAIPILLIVGVISLFASPGRVS